MHCVRSLLLATALCVPQVCFADVLDAFVGEGVTAKSSA